MPRHHAVEEMPDARQVLGPPLKAIGWHLQPPWSVNPPPSQPRFGWHPATQIYSLLAGRDESTGQIESDFAASEAGCIVLPVLHGPSTARAALRLMDAGSGSVLANLPFRERDELWSLWRVPLNSNVRRLRLSATGWGKAPGQWLAASAPRECK